MASLHLNHLSIVRGSRPIIQDMTWRLGAGEIGLVSGKNGSGKTTLLRCLAGLLPIAHGGFAINGVTHDNSHATRQQAYYIGHRNGLMPSMSGLANIRFHAHLLGMTGGHTACAAALARLGLGDGLGHRLAGGGIMHYPIRQLSQGQQRRVSLARLGLIRHEMHRLWLLDEPYAGLDSEASGHLTALITEYCGNGGSVVISSHASVNIAKGIPCRPLALTG